MSATVHIQWKGTEACFDFTCECGASGHVDASFAYAVECGSCGRKYDMPTTLRLLPYTDSADPVVAS